MTSVMSGHVDCAIALAPGIDEPIKENLASLASLGALAVYSAVPAGPLLI